MVEGVDVVHNYGHGGFEYQTSWGCTGTVVQLVDEVLNNVKARIFQSLLALRILQPRCKMNPALSCSDRACLRRASSVDIYRNVDALQATQPLSFYS